MSLELLATLVVLALIDGSCFGTLLIPLWLMLSPAPSAARLLLHDYVAPVLTRLEASMSRNANETMAWVVFLVGLYLVGEGWNAFGWY